MKVIDIKEFAASADMSNQGRKEKEPFFVRYAVAVVGKDEHARFQTWKSRDCAAPEAIGDPVMYFTEAKALAAEDLGRPISESWREVDPEGWWKRPASGVEVVGGADEQSRPLGDGGSDNGG